MINSKTFLLEYVVLRLGERRLGLLRKTVSETMLFLLVIGTLALTFTIQPLRADGTAYTDVNEAGRSKKKGI